MCLIFILFIKILEFLKIYQFPLQTWFILILTTIILSLIINDRHYIYLIQISEIFLNLLPSTNIHEFIKNILDNLHQSLELPRVYDRDYLTNSPLENIIPHGADRTGTGISAHTVNILPFLEYLDRLKRYEIWNFLFGTGSGTSSIFINSVSDSRNISNPHSLFINVLFNYGIIGLILLIFSLWKIVINLGKINNLKTNRILNGTYFLLLFPFLVNNNYMLYLLLEL